MLTRGSCLTKERELCCGLFLRNLTFLRGWLGWSQLRALSEFFRILSIPLQGVCRGCLYCAHRTSTVSSCAFCEQEWAPGRSLHPFSASC